MQDVKKHGRLGEKSGDSREGCHGFNMKKIYILHGWTYSTEKWGPFLTELEKAGLEPVMLKIPGLTAPLEQVWDIDDYVHWLERNFRNEKEQVILLGHSNGGLISLGFVLKYPDKVERLILVDSTGIYHREISIRLKKRIFWLAAKIGKKISKAPVFKKYLYRLARAHDYEKANPVMRKTMENLIQTDYAGDLKKISHQTLIIWGEYDKVTPVKDGVLMNQKIKNSKLHIVSGARHSPHLTHSKQTAKIIMDNL